MKSCFPLSSLDPYQVLQRNTKNSADLHLRLEPKLGYPVHFRLLDTQGKLVLQGAPEIASDTHGPILTISRIPVGGPWLLELEGKRPKQYGPFFVGDLWVIAGQSNIQGVGFLRDALPPHPLVQTFNMKDRWKNAREPVNDRSGTHYAAYCAADPFRKGESARAVRPIKGTGPGLAFGRAVVEKYGIPIGLIPCAVGGSSMQQWDPALASKGTESLYGAFLERLGKVGRAIKGILWYQGSSEANPVNHPVYKARMHALVEAFRRDTRNPRLPLVIGQGYAFFDTGRWNLDPISWSAIRQYQFELSQEIPRLDIFGVLDLDLDDGIHLSGKAQATVGQRMADCAGRLVYGDRTKRAPYVDKVRIRPNAYASRCFDILVSCRNVDGSLETPGDALACGFSVVDQNGQVVPTIYKTLLSGSRLTLHTELYAEDLERCSLYYGWGCQPMCNIRDGRGLPLLAGGPWPLGDDA